MWATEYIAWKWLFVYFVYNSHMSFHFTIFNLEKFRGTSTETEVAWFSRKEAFLARQISKDFLGKGRERRNNSD